MSRYLVALLTTLLTATSLVATDEVGTADTKTRPPTSMVAKTPAPFSLAPKVNLSVGSVWIGSGTGDRFAPLDHAPKLGETISLVCRVNITGSPPTGWRIAWFINGAKTCGEGTFTVLQHDCEHPWSMTRGTDVFIDYVPHQTGSLIYRCAVDVGGDVAETSELDNAKQKSFNVVLPLEPIPREKLPATRAPLGPRLRRGTAGPG